MSESKSNVPKLRFPGFTDPWEQRKLGEMATFSKGIGFSKGDFAEEGAQLFHYGRLYTDYECVVRSVDTYAAPKKDAVFSKGGEVVTPSSGETAEDIAVASVIASPGIMLGGGLNVIHPGAQLDPVFLALSISGGQQHRDLAKRAQGKSVVHLYNDDLAESSMMIPPHVSEQEAIGALFRDVDDLITLHQRKLDDVKQLKRGLLQKMFPKNGADVPEWRFPGFTDPWEQRKLGDVATITRGERFTANDYVSEGGIPCIHYGEIYTSYGTVATSAISQVRKELAPVLRYAAPGDIVMACTSENVEDVCKAVVWMGKSQVAYHDDSFAISFTGDPVFIASYFQTDEFFKRKATAAHGVKVMRVSREALADIAVSVPSLSEQRAIGALFHDVDDLITLHQRELDHVKLLKKALLQQMFV